MKLWPVAPFFTHFWNRGTYKTLQHVISLHVKFFHHCDKKFSKHVTVSIGKKIKISWKKGLKSGHLKTFELTLRFYTKNPHFMNALRNQKSQNVRTPCTTLLCLHSLTFKNSYYLVTYSREKNVIEKRKKNQVFSGNPKKTWLETSSSSQVLLQQLQVRSGSGSFWPGTLSQVKFEHFQAFCTP